MKYFVVNYDNKTITRFNTLKEARIYCQIALKFSISLCVFYYSSMELVNQDIDLSKFELKLKN